MPDSVPPSLIDAFFSAPNRLRYPASANRLIVGGEAAVCAAAPTIARFATGNLDWPLLLPAMLSDDGDVIWYVCTDSDLRLRAAIDEIHAFIGPTYSDFTGLRTELDRAHPLERALSDGFGTRVLKFCVPASKREKVSSQLARYLALLAQKPKAPIQAGDSFSQLRAKFDRALLAGNQDNAQQCLDALRAKGGLSAENLHFLNIRFYAALGKWEQIARYPLLSTLVNLQLPPETYNEIFEALYQTLLHQVEEIDDLPTLLLAFERLLFQPFSELFRTRRQSTRVTVLKGFICRELCNAQPDPNLCLSYLAQLPDLAFPPGITHEIRRQCEQLIAPDPAVAAAKAVDDEDFDKALYLYLSLPVTVETLRHMLRCAREIGNAETAARVIAIFDGAPLAVQNEVKLKSPAMYPKVCDLAAALLAIPPSASAPPAVIHPLDWNKANGETADAYVERWRNGIATWKAETYVDSVGFGTTAALIVESLALEAPDVFEQVYPLWYRFFIEDIEAVDTRLLPLYQALLETLHVRGLFAEDELTLVKRAAACVLDCNGGPPIYKQMLDVLTAILHANRSVSLIDWALEIADLLVTAKCPAVEERMRFLCAVAELAQQFVTRLTRLQFSLVNRMARESGLSEIPQHLPAAGDDAPAAIVVSGKVAIYSLDATIAARARDMLVQTYPNIRVELNHDSVCTERLKSLSRTADWFVFAWRCASHPAWHCVKGEMTNSSRLCWARGNGAASLAQAVEQRLLEMPT